MLTCPEREKHGTSMDVMAEIKGKKKIRLEV
jgi:hypothetical protein